MKPQLPLVLLVHLVLLVLPAGCTGEGAAEPESESPAGSETDRPTAEISDAFRTDLDLAASGDQVVRGEDGWLFFGPELRSLSVGPFWGEDAAGASRAPRDDAKDPLPAILDFHRQLAERGIRLLFAPVPAKAALYPRRISAAARDALPAGGPPPRLDLAHGEFLAVLEENGVETVDLLAADLDAWSDGNDRLACRQDTHWSGRGAEVAARLLAERIGPVGEEEGRSDFTTETRDVEITGDLWRDLGDDGLPKETLPLTFVSYPDGSPLTPDRSSPVLLLGDSHTLVFHAGGDLHAEGAGLFEHLSRELGVVVDLIGVRGSGATPARVNLLRREDGLEGKKVVVWVLSVREYTEGQGWQQVPVERPG